MIYNNLVMADGTEHAFFTYYHDCERTTENFVSNHTRKVVPNTLPYRLNIKKKLFEKNSHDGMQKRKK